MNFTEEQLEEGRSRLARLLPDAKAEAKADLRKGGTEVEVLTARGQAVDRYIRIDNLEALVVHSSDQGWYADILLKEVPPGIANVMGTPTSHPLATREEAEEAAATLLRMGAMQSALNTGASADTPETDVRPFSIYDLTIDLPGEAVDMIVGAGAVIGQSRDEMAVYSFGRMREVCDRHGIDETTTADAMNSLSDENMMEIVRLSCMLASCGHIAYPPQGSLTFEGTGDVGVSGAGETPEDKTDTDPS